jgi:hypothetical protein
MFNILQESTPSKETNKTIECGKDETKEVGRSTTLT